MSTRVCVVSAVFLLAVCGTPSHAQVSKKSNRALYAEDRQRTRDAFARKDDKALRESELQLRKDFPGRSAVPEELAAAEARLGNEGAALDWLRQSVEMRLVPKLDDPAFDALRKSGKLDALSKQVDKNKELTSHSSSVFRFASSDLLTEDIAYDAEAKRFLISSVRQRKIMSCSASGQCEDFVSAADASFKPLWAVFALRIDPSKRFLWATTASVPFESAHDKDEEGRCALLKIELRTRKLDHRYDCEPGAKHEMGDMTVASNGDVFISDGGTGDVFVLRSDGKQLEKLVPSGTFVSPQTAALSADASLLYVPDYVAGTAAVRLSNGEVEWLTCKTPCALDGIDGLYSLNNRLIAIQNGTSPERIVSFRFGTPTQVDAWEVLEANWLDLGDPTHGVQVGGDFYFIANSGWDRVDREGVMTPGKPAEIRKLDLSRD